MLNFFHLILISYLLFCIGFFGIILNRTNILIILICIEILLISVNFNFIIFSIYLDDFIGLIFSLYILTIAAVESAIGLALLICYYNQLGFIEITHLNFIKS